MTQKEYKIVKSRENWCSTWDVDENGYVRNERGKPLVEVCKYLEEGLRAEPEVWNSIDYFNPHYKEVPIWPIDAHWIAVFCVLGESEGYYIHCEAIKGDKRVLLVLAKTLSEDLEVGLRIANNISRSIYQKPYGGAIVHSRFIMIPKTKEGAHE